LRNLDIAKYKHFMKSAAELSGEPPLRLLLDCVRSSLAYNVSLLEYFQFEFAGARPSSRKEWAGTGYMYEYQRVMNPPGARQMLDDKREFFAIYNKYFRHKVFTSAEIAADVKCFELLKTPSKKIVVKVSDGKCGSQVEVLDATNLARDALLARMEEGGYDMAEQFVVQHSELNRLSPSAVNTVRIITQLTAAGDVDILGCRLRISVNSEVDNLAAGNIAAPIDEQTGMVYAPAVYADVALPPEAIHPVTKEPIVGFQVPFWSECLQLAKDAALHDTRNRSIGWDIVVTDSGPGLIEGNHDWCKLVWQLPVKRGLRSLLDKHWREFIRLRSTESGIEA
jgi:hypothetical protein